MIGKIKQKYILITILLILTVPTCLAVQTENINQENPCETSMGSKYTGQLRIYIVEIKSRWDMDNGAPYKHAFLDYAFNDEIDIRYNNTYENSLTWQGEVEEDNVQIIAAIFNEKSHLKYADPPIGRPFNAHYIDAAAGVKPGETESNFKNNEFTHTVVCEVGTATWCAACPSMADTLEKIYKYGDYPFYYIEMVTDMSDIANNRMGDYNIKYLPTGFYDGGFDIVIGGGYETSHHKDIIENCGEREVHDLDFTLSSEWLGDGSIDININITNNEELPNNPPEKPEITGPTSGNYSENHEYEISTIDPDGDELYYYIDWGDNTDSGWLGPYSSGVAITANHIWSEQGIFIIKVKAKDTDDAETDWTWLEVTMPKQFILQNLFKQLLQFFPTLYQYLSILIDL
jgi:thiol-disulfide isomerase/thioredoxin